jgi:very-short-patch-repair endonuclease
MIEPSDLLHTLGGIARGTHLQQFGATRAQLAVAARTGTISRIRQGVYALSTADPKVVAAAAHGGALTCADALRAHGVWVLPQVDPIVHVWVGRSGRRHPHTPCECISHHSPGTAGLGLAPVAAALIHAYRCLDQEAFFAAYESAWNQRLLSAPDRKRIRRELPKSAHWLLDLARPDAESGLESILRLRLHLLGIRLDCQVVIGGVGRVDFVAERRVIIEVDGRRNHDGPEMRHKDLTRDAAASRLGFETLRFDYAMIIHDWDAVVRAVMSAVARARR